MASKNVTGPVPQFTTTRRTPRTCGLDGYFRASYAELVSVFGRPNGKSDGYKTSTNWFLEEGATGLTLEVYDYKATALYSRGMPSVSSFRRHVSYDWHVGCARMDLLETLVAYLSTRLGREVTWWGAGEPEPGPGRQTMYASCT